jgi:hypothetical protein
LRQALEIREQEARDPWNTFETRSRLGGSRLGQKKYAEAEPLLPAGYKGMRAHEDKIPARDKRRLDEAGSRIIQLYDAWGKMDKAEEWRRNLEETMRSSDFPADPFAR